MKLINGKEKAALVYATLRERVQMLRNQGKRPGLATVLVGDDPASAVYVSSKIKKCEELGIASFHHRLPATATQAEIIETIQKLNADPAVSGILLQLPVPAGIDADACIETIDPRKDVDGLHPMNAGKLMAAKQWSDIERKNLLIPCTPRGCIELLKTIPISLEGAYAVVVGRSQLVGKPIAQLLMAHHATVTMAHSRTKNIDRVCAQADVLVAAIGKPRFIKAGFVKPGAVVIDVGINRTPQGMCGDVDFDAVKDIAGYITPVPGGVGAMTVAMLMYNTIQTVS